MTQSEVVRVFGKKSKHKESLVKENPVATLHAELDRLEKEALPLVDAAAKRPRQKK